MCDSSTVDTTAPLLWTLQEMEEFKCKQTRHRWVFSVWQNQSMLVSKTGMCEYKFQFTLIISCRPCKQKSKDQAITLDHYASLDKHKYTRIGHGQWFRQPINHVRLHLIIWKLLRLRYESMYQSSESRWDRNPLTDLWSQSNRTEAGLP